MNRKVKMLESLDFPLQFLLMQTQANEMQTKFWLSHCKIRISIDILAFNLT